MLRSDSNRPDKADGPIVDRLWDKRAELLWGLVVAIMLLTFVDPVVLVGGALAIATVAAGWVGFHELLERAKQDEARQDLAPLRAAETERRTPGATPSPTPWHSHHAA